MKLRLSRAHWPVTVLGPGRRIGIWFQGCSIRCPGCVSKDTWSRDEGRAVDLGLLVGWCRVVSRGKPDGITLSGGEPFDQPGGLDALLDALDAWRRTLPRPFDILCYSGHPLAQLRRQFPRLLARLDGLIPEPFEQDQPTSLAWRGSANQPLLSLSALGDARYGPFFEARPPARMQVSVSDHAIWYVGIPRVGGMQAVETLAREEGLVQEAVSWRA